MDTQNRTDREMGLENIIESMYTAAALEPLNEKHARAECDHPGCKGGKHPSGADCKKCGGDGWIDAKDLKTGPKKNVEEAEDTGRIPHDVDSFGDKPRVGDEATGDPSTFQVGQILRSSQTGDGLDGIIIDISEEDGELSFHLMEIGEEGWTVRASDIKPSTRPRANW
jgi:hypothetical protein